MFGSTDSLMKQITEANYLTKMLRIQIIWHLSFLGVWERQTEFPSS